MQSSITVRRKKRGRPATGTDPLLAVRFPQATIDALESRAVAEETNKSELVRQYVEAGLKRPPKVKTG